MKQEREGGVSCCNISQDFLLSPPMHGITYKTKTKTNVACANELYIFCGLLLFQQNFQIMFALVTL